MVNLGGTEGRERGRDRNREAGGKHRWDSKVARGQVEKARWFHTEG